MRVFGLNFPNPVGIAAGFDKNAEVPDALLRVGFGFVEVGTITPMPQAGNPRPRLFRLDADAGVINRLGFNSQGADAVLRRLAARAAPRRPQAGQVGGGIVGINVGANKDTPDRIADYVRLIERFAAVASYVTVNISSPNTPGLRNMQQAAVLDDLLARVIDARERVAPNAGPTPVLLKIAPDLSLPDLDDVVGIARSRRVDGMIVGNTTVTRPKSLHDVDKAKEAGGLSGRPLLPLANRMLAETYVRVEGVFPLIGAGGIDSGASALGKIRAGASLIQVYSGLVFRGLRPCRRDQRYAARRARTRPADKPRRLCRRRCGVCHRRAVAGSDSAQPHADDCNSCLLLNKRLCRPTTALRVEKAAAFRRVE